MTEVPGRVPLMMRESRIVGLRPSPFDDLYHRIVGGSWTRLLATLVAGYLAVNAAFAAVYVASGDCIHGARRGSFEDAFFFSVQTLSTIGYGVMSPKGRVGNVIVMGEALSGMIGLAVATGLIFAKFSKPTARVMFSRFAVVTARDGVPTLMFRLANGRQRNRIVEATIRVVLAKNETTQEGESVRRFYDLPLARTQTALFALSWTVMSPLGAGNPFSAETPDTLKAADAELVVSLVGLDDTLAQTVHARHSYGADQIVFGARLVDMVSQLPDGSRLFDYGKFHDVAR